MSKVQLHEDVRAIRDCAPKGSTHLLIQTDGIGYWLGYRKGEVHLTRASADFGKDVFRSICLKNGCVAIRMYGRIHAVPQSQWVAARKRKSRK